MKLGKVRGVLGVALLATLLAVYFAPSPAEDGVVLSEHAHTLRDSGATVASSAVVAQGEAAMQPIEVLSIRSREDESEEGQAEGVFAPVAWTTPQVGAPVAAPSPPPLLPQAPPLPFRALGRYVEDGQTAIFLQYNDRNLVARVGDTIAEQYKLESLNGDVMSFQYMPLNQTQTLKIGEGN